MCVLPASRVAQAKMSFEWTLAGASSGNFAQLPQCLAADGGFYPDFGSNSRTVGDGSHELHFEPAIGVAVVAIKAIVLGDMPAIGHKQIEKSVVVVIGPGATQRIGYVV